MNGMNLVTTKAKNKLKLLSKNLSLVIEKEQKRIEIKTLTQRILSTVLLRMT